MISNEIFWIRRMIEVLKKKSQPWQIKKNGGSTSASFVIGESLSLLIALPRHRCSNRLGLHLMVLSWVGTVHSDHLVQWVLRICYPRSRATPSLPLFRQSCMMAIHHLIISTRSITSHCEFWQPGHSDFWTLHDHGRACKSWRIPFFFFCSIGLALYMMMVITVRAVSRPHATCLAIVLMALIFITAITASIQVVVHGSGCQVL